MIYLVLALALTVGSLNRKEVVIDCDLIEVNHCFCSGVDIKQLIFYEWSPDYRRYNVIAWRQLTDATGPFKSSGRTAYRFQHWEGNGTVVFRSWMVRRTETARDPERDNKVLHDDLLRPRIER